MTKTIALAVLGLGLVAGQAAAQTVPSQLYFPFRVDVGLTGADQLGTGRGGFGASIEPKFALTDNVNVGLRFDAVALFGGSVSGDGSSVSVGIGAAESFLLKGEYLLGTHAVRPFVSLGIGGYNIAGEDVSTSSSSTMVHQKAGAYFGIAPELGLDLGRVRLAVVYNIIVGATQEVTQDISTGGAPTKDDRSLNYLTFEFAVRFGGGKKF